MKPTFSIAASPEFRFQLSVAEVSTIIRCANIHYDFTCKGAAREGGILITWRKNAKFRWPIHASFRDIDLVSKILEHPLDKDKLVATKIKKLIGAMVRKYHDAGWNRVEGRFEDKLPLFFLVP